MTISVLLLILMVWLAGFLWSLKVSRLQKLVNQAKQAKVKEQRRAETQACATQCVTNYARVGVGLGEAMLRLDLVPASSEELARAYRAHQVEQMRALSQSPHVTTLVFTGRGGSA